MRTMRKTVAPVLTVLTAIVLTACGSSTPKVTVQTADGVPLTAAGTKLAFGQSATVVSRPSAAKSSPLAVTVTRVTKAPVAQLARYGVGSMPGVVPYYVYLNVKNVGTGNLGGTPIPLYLQDSKNVLVSFSPIKGKFAPCASQPLPKWFGHGGTVNTCLIFLLTKSDPATLVSYRPVQTVEPITWSGTIGGLAAKSAK